MTTHTERVELSVPGNPRTPGTARRMTGLIGMLLAAAIVSTPAAAVRGVDPEQAREWLYRALEGDAAAQFNIAAVYERIAEDWKDDDSPPPRHEGIPVANYAGGNYLRAYAWYTAAANQRVADAEQRRRRLAPRLTEQERAAVQSWMVEVLLPVVAVVSMQ